MTDLLDVEYREDGMTTWHPRRVYPESTIGLALTRNGPGYRFAANGGIYRIPPAVRDAAATFRPAPLADAMVDFSKGVAAIVRPTVDAGTVRHVDPATGGAKDQKPERYDLIPPAELAIIARQYGYGAGKYGDYNWTQGYKWSLSFAAMMRHAWAFWRGEDDDPESGLPHMAAVVFHAMTLMHRTSNHRQGDDRPGPVKPDPLRETMNDYARIDIDMTRGVRDRGAALGPDAWLRATIR